MKVTLPAVDIFTPNISYTPISGQYACGNVTLTASITDVGQGVYLTGAQTPRMYIRRSSPTTTSWGSVTGTYTGTANNSVWTFTVNYYAVLGINPAASEVYQYFVVAKDHASNIWFSKFDATTPTFTGNDITESATAPTSPDSYTLNSVTPVSVSVTTGPANSNPNACTGNSVNFTITATGTPPITYQWYKGIASINAASNSSYSISSLSLTDAGTYSCVVSNSCASVTSTATTLTVNQFPVITAGPSPLSDTKCVGLSTSFTVTASGSAPLTYQWYYNNSTLLTGQTTSVFSKSFLVTGDAGSYTCVISNSCSPNVTSTAATLIVNSLPAISTNPSTPPAVCQRTGTSTFTVAAPGYGTLSYQWQQNTITLSNSSTYSGVTSATLTITNPGIGLNNNQYRCVVASSCSPAATSTAATLTVYSILTTSIKRRLYSCLL